jgi:hypothetical protein
MQDQPIRPWREIAAQLTHETETSKILDLCEELNRALDSAFETSKKSESADLTD